MGVNAEVSAAVAEAHREQWGFVLAATVRITRDLDAAEECVQDAYAHALTSWASGGLPASPGAWLTTVARRRAIDIIRRDETLRAKLPLLLDSEPDGAGQVHPDAPLEVAADVPDDRLRLIFTCCHPTLAPEAQVALTLRLLCGLSTTEVARAFLVQESTMAARITRAKKKISAARIPYRVPSAAELPSRVDAVLDVIHLLFTTGHTATAGHNLQRRDLVERAMHLARMMSLLLPDDAGTAGLLALILLTDARRHTRTGPDGQLVLLAEQDRSQWDTAEISEGVTLVRKALRRRPPGRFALMAAIAAIHTEARMPTDTNWREIADLYDVLIDIWPSPVVALNRAVAIGEAHGPQAGIAALDPLATERQLAGYHYLPAARAEFLRRLGRAADARLAYQEALILTENSVERDFLQRRLDEV